VITFSGAIAISSYGVSLGNENCAEMGQKRFLKDS
jgi:hypothetical protein